MRGEPGHAAALRAAGGRGRCGRRTDTGCTRSRWWGGCCWCAGRWRWGLRWESWRGYWENGTGAGRRATRCGRWRGRSWRRCGTSCGSTGRAFGRGEAVPVSGAGGGAVSAGGLVVGAGPLVPWTEVPATGKKSACADSGKCRQVPLCGSRSWHRFSPSPAAPGEGGAEGRGVRAPGVGAFQAPRQLLGDGG